MDTHVISLVSVRAHAPSGRPRCAAQDSCAVEMGLQLAGDKLQARPRAHRCLLKVRLPVLATVDNAAPKPRQSAFGPGRRGVIDAAQVEVINDDLFTSAELQPAKPRPKRLKVIKAKSGADRMKAATAKASGGTGQVLKGLSAEEGAQAILKVLVEEGVVR
jgi:electron transfer flavoprotein beta subunit